MTKVDDQTRRRANDVSMTFNAKPYDTLHVRTVELSRFDARMRFSFPRDMRIEDAFCAPAVDAIESLVAEALERPDFLKMPDFAIRTNDLVLADCSAVVADMDDGGQQIIVRFRDHYGDILSLFPPDSNAREMLRGGASHHAIAALEKAYVPLLDIAGHIAEMRKSGELVAGDKSSDALLAISEKIEAMRVSRVLTQDLAAGKTASSAEDARLPGGIDRTPLAVN